MNEEFVIKKGVLEEYNGTDEVVTVPEGVHVIGYGAFQPNLEMDGEAERLKKVILPETVCILVLLWVEGGRIAVQS